MDSVFFSAVPLLDHRYDNWRDKSIEDIVQLVDGIAGETQDFLNNFYDLLSERIFNVPKENHRFQIKKEFVSRSGLWVSKKRYAQWIIAENGIAKDELDVKGLDVKRSSFPKAFQKVMADVLISILKGKTEDEVTDIISDFRSNMKSMNVVDISKNSAVKDMSKYMPKKRQPFSLEKGTPAHVKAAILYNDCLKHFNCAFKYEPLRSGDKVKWAYLKSNPLGIDALAFKGDNDPSEIMEFITTYIDHNRILDSELTEKLQDFYDCVNWGSVVSVKREASKFFAF